VGKSSPAILDSVIEGKGSRAFPFSCHEKVQVTLSGDPGKTSGCDVFSRFSKKNTIIFQDKLFPHLPLWWSLA
jgi:hypothetical protein